MMSQGDKELVEESKLPDPSLVDAGDGGGNDSHGDTGHGGAMQAVTQLSSMMMIAKTGSQKF